MKLLNCFERVSGLKVNYHKSLNYGLGVSLGEVERLALRGGCKVDNLPFTYLGLPIGRNMNRVKIWKPVFDKFNSKLASIRRNFLFGYATGERAKLTWVKWEDSLLPYSEGGLNIGSRQGKNLALLGKWFWRIKKKPSSLWVSILKSIHGANWIHILLGPNRPVGKTGVWLNIISAGYSIDKTGLGTSFVKQIGDGNNKFWTEPWLSGEMLKDRFL
ncbi:uncharacterized protein [Rutidosis leptorrhynchoides]|uniref:uncharacterized protein n=1 Tax=Rutidosis leptorrhynchoides TaxID=125765 RepID=UPI003A99023C